MPPPECWSGVILAGRNTTTSYPASRPISMYSKQPTVLFYFGMQQRNGPRSDPARLMRTSILEVIASRNNSCSCPNVTAVTLSQVEQPVRLDGKLCGLVEGWANGCDWSELVASTSLDQGDLCRILRRAMEMLRQIPVLVRIQAASSWSECVLSCCYPIRVHPLALLCVDIVVFVLVVTCLSKRCCVRSVDD